jgi:hypothetical protein
MTSVLALMALGFLLGMRHATDPDHVIAVTTIVDRQKSASGAATIGAAWGLGHTLTILVVGGGIILFGWVIPPSIGLSMEFSVGLMLIVLGIMNLTGVMRRMADSRLMRVRPLVVGVVHGLAGSAAVALLILTTIRNPEWALWYLLVFGLGTIVGMMLMTAVIVVPFTRTSHHFARVGGGLRIASGVVSIAFGLFIAYRVGVVDGLFAGSPAWTPY